MFIAAVLTAVRTWKQPKCPFMHKCKKKFIHIYIWCWERLRAGGEGDDRGWDGWMASPTRWTWVWVDSRSWWWTGRPGVLLFMGSQRVGHDWATELNLTDISQMSHILYYSALKKRSYHTQYKDEAVSYMLNKIKQIDKEKKYIISFICRI